MPKKEKPILIPETDKTNSYIKMQTKDPEQVAKNRFDLINLINYIETVTTIPTYTPKKFYESIKIYMDDLSSPTVKRLYIYSFEAGAWNYVTLT